MRKVLLGYMPIVLGCMASMLAIGLLLGANETGQDVIQLLRQRLRTVMPGSYMTSGCLPAVPVASTTLAPFACDGVVMTGVQSIPVSQVAAQVGPLVGGDGVYWLMLHPDRTTPVAGWTRQTGTHYLWIKSATQPILTQGALISKVTISAAVILMVDDFRAPSSLVRNGTYDVTDPLYGGVADDSTDIGPAWQKAVNAASLQGGRTVRLPHGKFKQTTGVVLSYAVEVTGEGWSPLIPAFFVPPAPYHADHQGGTTIHISSAAFVPITINASGVTVHNLAFEHDQPTPGLGWIPTDYPSTIALNNDMGIPISDINLENLFFRSATRGITYTSTNGVSAGRINIRNIWGQFFLSGIYLDYITDTTRISDVHMWPYWSQDAGVFLYQANNLSSMTILRCDGCLVTNFFSFQSHFGLNFSNGPNGGINGFEGHNILFDGAVVGIFHNQSTGGSASFVNFATNGAFTGLTPAPGFATSTGIFFAGTGAYFTFVNFDAVFLGASCASVGTGGNAVTITNLRCINWDLGLSAVPAFSALGTSTLSLHGAQTISTPSGAPHYVGTFLSPLLATGGTYSTGGVKKYVCSQDGVLTVGATCP